MIQRREFITGWGGPEPCLVAPWRSVEETTPTGALRSPVAPNGCGRIERPKGNEILSGQKDNRNRNRPTRYGGYPLG
jgi:hypothetical protein